MPGVPFSPFPDIFLSALDDAARLQRPVIEIGCGDGRMLAAMAHRGVEAVGIDRISPELGSQADIVGDARSLPLRPAAVEIVVVANLLHHLLPGDGAAEFVRHWQGLLCPTGRLFIFGDVPANDPPAVRNFRNLQDLLGRITGGGRGPLRTMTEVRNLLDDGTGRWVFGQQENGRQPDTDAVIAFLAGEGVQPGGEVAALLAAIEAEGLDYGDYWWACWNRGRSDREE